MRQLFCAVLVAALLLGCVGSEVTKLRGASADRSPVDTSEIKVYADTSALNCTYDYLAVIELQALSTLASRKTAIGKAKVQAGKLGANALVIDHLNRAAGPGARESRFTALHEQRPCK